MPLRSYWTIVMEGRPTAFRAADQDELVPTLRQLQVRHPDTHLMWFANGRYWRSPLDARRPAPRPGNRPTSSRPPGKFAARGQSRRGLNRRGPGKGRNR
jgi:hypothetical protein